MGLASTALRWGNHAVTGLYRGTGGRMMASVQKTPVLILTVPGRRSAAAAVLEVQRDPGVGNEPGSPVHRGPKPRIRR